MPGGWTSARSAPRSRRPLADATQGSAAPGSGAPGDAAPGNGAPGDGSLNARYADARNAEAEARQALAGVLMEYAELLRHVGDRPSRGKLRRRIWEVERALGRRDLYHSQAGQDAFLDETVFAKEGGIFVEVGAYDGVTGSNTLFFEQRRGWTGFLVEPSPRLHAMASVARKAPCLQCAAGAEAGEAEFLDIRAGLSQMGGLVDSYDPAIRAQVEADPRHEGEIIRVPVRTLPDMLDAHGLTEIDYISLDVEGGELAVLGGFPFDRFRVAAWTVENNTADRAIGELMERSGYKCVEVLGVDEVYVRADMLDAIRARQRGGAAPG